MFVFFSFQPWLASYDTFSLGVPLCCRMVPSDFFRHRLSAVGLNQTPGKFVCCTITTKIAVSSPGLQYHPQGCSIIPRVAVSSTGLQYHPQGFACTMSSKAHHASGREGQEKYVRELSSLLWGYYQSLLWGTISHSRGVLSVAPRGVLSVTPVGYYQLLPWGTISCSRGVLSVAPVGYYQSLC
jgi:hypothetical protein